MQHFDVELPTEVAEELLSAMQAEYPDHALTLAKLGAKLLDTMPKALSHRFTLDATKRVRWAQFHNILDAIEVATSPTKCVRPRSLPVFKLSSG